MSRENKTFQVKIETKGVSTNDVGQEFGHLECYAAVFNVIDQGNDQILPGAFKRTIQNAKNRAASRQKKYLIPILWQHNPDEVIGGWHTLSEDSYGLKCIGDINLATQRGREYWELAKADMSDSFSIVYDVPSGGSSYNKSGVRELSELRLFSCDPVTFPMCEETMLVNVKSMQTKTIVGNTSGPIGPRDEAWDGSKAEGQIWDAAYDEDSGKINTTLAKKYFMVQDGDGTKKGDYSLPFWYVGDSPHICVGAVKAIAAWVQGARG
jgi:HK97 family phage prohead protease